MGAKVQLDPCASALRDVACGRNAPGLGIEALRMEGDAVLLGLGVRTAADGERLRA